MIFDINGEYANDNPQDNNKSIRSAYPEKCVVYALTKKENTPSKDLKINFYEHPNQSHRIIRTLLNEEGKKSNYIQSFLSVDIPSIESLDELKSEQSLRRRATTKILIYWAILKDAGLEVKEDDLLGLLDYRSFKFNDEAMKQIFGKNDKNWVHPKDNLVEFFKRATEKNRSSKLPSSTKGKNLFDSDDDTLLDFLNPKGSTSSGTKILQKIRKYHSPKAGNSLQEILDELEKGQTVIIDLGNADEEVMKYFLRELSEAVFWKPNSEVHSKQIKQSLCSTLF